MLMKARDKARQQTKPRAWNDFVLTNIPKMSISNRLLRIQT
jgi:hypothetical protein